MALTRAVRLLSDTKPGASDGKNGSQQAAETGETKNGGLHLIHRRPRSLVPRSLAHDGSHAQDRRTETDTDSWARLNCRAGGHLLAPDGTSLPRLHSYSSSHGVSKRILYPYKFSYPFTLARAAWVKGSVVTLWYSMFSVT